MLAKNARSHLSKTSFAQNFDEVEVIQVVFLILGHRLNGRPNFGWSIVLAAVRLRFRLFVIRRRKFSFRRGDG